MCVYSVKERSKVESNHEPREALLVSSQATGHPVRMLQDSKKSGR